MQQAASVRESSLEHVNHLVIVMITLRMERCLNKDTCPMTSAHQDSKCHGGVVEQREKASCLGHLQAHGKTPLEVTLEVMYALLMWQRCELSGSTMNELRAVMPAWEERKCHWKHYKLDQCHQDITSWMNIGQSDSKIASSSACLGTTAPSSPPKKEP